MNQKTKFVTINALGIALYCVLAMSIRIPLIGHIAVDLGYIVLAVYAYKFGAISGMMVGSIGAAIISTLTGWFAPGWVLGNAVIGLLTGKLYRREGKYKTLINIGITVAAVFIGILGIKTVVECTLYSIPYPVKIPKNLVAAITDSIAMCLGLTLKEVFKTEV